MIKIKYLLLLVEEEEVINIPRPLVLMKELVEMLVLEHLVKQIKYLLV